MFLVLFFVFVETFVFSGLVYDGLELPGWMDGWR